MVEHVRMATSLFEGRPVSRAEVLAMLDRAKRMRQQGIGRSDEPEYRPRESEKDSS